MFLVYFPAVMMFAGALMGLRHHDKAPITMAFLIATLPAYVLAHVVATVGFDATLTQAKVDELLMILMIVIGLTASAAVYDLGQLRKLEEGALA